MPHRVLWRSARCGHGILFDLCVSVIAGQFGGVGALRLLIGSDPARAATLGLAPVRKLLHRCLAGDLSAEPFTEETLRLVERLIAYLRQDKVAVRHYERGFLHAKAYLFHHDQVGPSSLNDRLQPFAAIVGSSNFTGPGLVSNRELNVVHRVLTDKEDPVDEAAVRSIAYLDPETAQKLLPGPLKMPLQLTSSDVLTAKKSPDVAERRMIKSEVGARAVNELTEWFERQWAASVDFKADLIDFWMRASSAQRVYSVRSIHEGAF